jgi:hypothetical protein
MQALERKRVLAHSPVALAFAAAMAGAPAMAAAAPGEISVPVPHARAGAELAPSTAVLNRLNSLALRLAQTLRPQWVEIWPEVTHVESVPR